MLPSCANFTIDFINIVTYGVTCRKIEEELNEVAEVTIFGPVAEDFLRDEAATDPGYVARMRNINTLVESRRALHG